MNNTQQSPVEKVPFEKKPTEKTKVVRGAKRANYDPAIINAILDSHFLCHVGFVIDGEARIIPTAYVRIDDAIYVHGNLHNQMMTALLDGQSACISVTLVDGMVLARSAFHHSVNYRSVVIYAKGEKVEGDHKITVLDALINHYVPGRVQHLRPYLQKELDATLVVKLPITEASAKMRSGPPVDADKDYELNIWAGVLNVKTVIDAVEPCDRLSPSVAVPDHVQHFVSEHGLIDRI